MYDPSGDTKLDGKDIIALLAAEFDVPLDQLEFALWKLIHGYLEK